MTPSPNVPSQTGTAGIFGRTRCTCWNTEEKVKGGSRVIRLISDLIIGNKNNVPVKLFCFCSSSFSLLVYLTLQIPQTASSLTASHQCFGYLSLRCLAFTWVIWPLEKSKTSSLSSLRMIMLFWQRLSLVRLAPTMSLMKVGQCLGHSCFRIWREFRESELCITTLRVTSCQKHRTVCSPARGSCSVSKCKPPRSAKGAWKQRRQNKALLLSVARFNVYVNGTSPPCWPDQKKSWWSARQHISWCLHMCHTVKSSITEAEQVTWVKFNWTDLHTDSWGESSSAFWWLSPESAARNTERKTEL